MFSVKTHASSYVGKLHDHFKGRFSQKHLGKGLKLMQQWGWPPTVVDFAREHLREPRYNPLKIYDPGQLESPVFREIVEKAENAGRDPLRRLVTTRRLGTPQVLATMGAPDKSISLVALLHPNKNVRRMVQQMHRKATEEANRGVRACLEMCNKHPITILGYSTVHVASSQGDPHFHSHDLMRVFQWDGQTGALMEEKITGLRTLKRLSRAIYHGHLYGRLYHVLGSSVGMHMAAGQAMPFLKDVPHALIEAFSRARYEMLIVRNLELKASHPWVHEHARRHYRMKYPGIELLEHTVNLIHHEKRRELQREMINWWYERAPELEACMDMIRPVSWWEKMRQRDPLAPVHQGARTWMRGVIDAETLDRDVGEMLLETLDTIYCKRWGGLELAALFVEPLELKEAFRLAKELLQYWIKRGRVMRDAAYVRSRNTSKRVLMTTWLETERTRQMRVKALQDMQVIQPEPIPEFAPRIFLFPETLKQGMEALRKGRKVVMLQVPPDRERIFMSHFRRYGLEPVVEEKAFKELLGKKMRGVLVLQPDTWTSCDAHEVLAWLQKQEELQMICVTSDSSSRSSLAILLEEVARGGGTLFRMEEKDVAAPSRPVHRWESRWPDRQGPSSTQNTPLRDQDRPAPLPKRKERDWDLGL